MLLTRANYYLRRAFVGHRDILSESGPGKVLCDRSTSVGDRAIFLDGQLEKVVAFPPPSTRQYQFSLVEGGVREHSETLLFDVGAAVLMDGTLYKGGTKRTFGRITPEQTERLRLATMGLASSGVGVKFFGHWLSDDCLTYELASDYGAALCIRTPPWPDKQYYANAFQQDWTPVDRAYIDRLFVFSDYAQNDLKLARYLALRERLQTMLSTRERYGIVYLKRGRSAADRSMDNEDEIIELLSTQGVAICQMEDTPIPETLRQIMGARLVISVEGSQLSHTTFVLREGAGVLVIQPPEHFNAVHKGWMERLGISFGLVVGDPTDSGYKLNPDELQQTIDLMLRHLQARGA